jgi:hypothetical protein
MLLHGIVKQRMFIGVILDNSPPVKGNENVMVVMVDYNVGNPQFPEFLQDFGGIPTGTKLPLPANATCIRSNEISIQIIAANLPRGNKFDRARQIRVHIATRIVNVHSSR